MGTFDKTHWTVLSFDEVTEFHAAVDNPLTYSGRLEYGSPWGPLML